MGTNPCFPDHKREGHSSRKKKKKRRVVDLVSDIKVNFLLFRLFLTWRTNAKKSCGFERV